MNIMKRIEHKTTVLIYSANIKPMNNYPESDIWNPPTNSLSASDTSNTTRLLSAMEIRINVKYTYNEDIKW